MTVQKSQNLSVQAPETVNGLLDHLDHLLSENKETADSLRISAYVPVGKISEAAEEGRITLRNLVQRTLKSLRNEGIEDPNITTALHHALELTDQEEITEDFWQHQDKGLAAFIDRRGIRIVKIGETFEPQCSISGKWHLSPLLQIAANVNPFWLLCLSQNKVQLYRGSKLAIREVEAPGMPVSYETSTTGMARVEGDDPESGVVPPEKNEIQLFFKEIDQSLKPVFEGSQAPLVIASVDEHFPVYRDANTYEKLSLQLIPGNPDHSRPEELHARAMELLTEHHNRSRELQISRIKDLLHEGRAVTEVNEVIQAAVSGRIKALVAPADKFLWGTFDRGNQRVTPQNKSSINNIDLYQLAAEETLSHGGELFYLSSDQMPGESKICAELRY